jgi:hypothetical protein
MSTDQFVDANRASSNVLQHNPHKRPSGTLSLSTDDENYAKRARRFWHSDGQNGSDEPSLQRGQANGHEISGNVVELGGTRLASGLSRQQFSHFRLSPKRLRLVFVTLFSVLVANASFTENRNTKYYISRCLPL